MPEADDRRGPRRLHALLAPRSVAVVGASRNSTTFGSLALANLRNWGFKGALFAVNPSESEIDGVTCYPRITDLPTTPDLCVIALRADLVPEVVQQCADRGVPAVTVVGSGFAESSTVEGIERQRQISEIARAHGICLLGPNTLGAAGFTDGAVSAASANIPRDLRAGTVGIVSQSGGLGTTILAAAARHGLGIDSFVALGNEAGVSAPEVIRHYVDRGLSAVLCYVETIRDVASFSAAARFASDKGVPVVLLKGGTQPGGKAVAAAHTASLAGSTRVLDAALATWNIARVSSIDALVGAGVLFSAFGRARGDRCGVLGLGGGNSALLADALESGGLRLASISDATRTAIMQILPDSNGANPLDAGGWFLGRGPHLLEQALNRFAEDDAIDVLVYGMVPLAPMRESVYVDAIAASATATSKPTISLSGHTPLTDLRRERYADAGVIELPCTDAAVDALSAWQRLSQSGSVDHDCAAAATETDDSRIAEIADLIGDLAPGEQRTLLEDSAIELLTKLGLTFPDLCVVDEIDQAVIAAESFGYPVVVKALAPGLTHRAQLGAVAVGIRNDVELRAATSRVLDNARTAVQGNSDVRLLVQRQVEGGTEMIVGVQNDPVMGPVVLVGLGGVWSEIIDDVAFLLPPVTADRARAALRGLRAGQQLRRLTSAGEFDEDALVELLLDVSRVVALLGDRIESLDLNPVIVGPKGLAMVDALAIIRGPHQ